MEDSIDTGEFEQACVAAARTFGRADGIRVVFQGQLAMTDGTTICVPSLDRTKPLDRQTAMVARGYIDHEAGHIRHTDMRLWKEAMQRAEDRGDQYFHMILNAIEDIRMEDCVITEYPGSAKNVDAMNEALMEGVAETAKTMDMSDWRVSMPITILAMDMKRRCEAGIANLPSIDKVIDVLPKDCKEQAAIWLKAIDGCRRIVEYEGRDRTGAIATLRNGKPGTEDAIAIAEMICKESHEKKKVEATGPGAPGDGKGNGNAPGAPGTAKDKKHDGTVKRREDSGAGGGVGGGASWAANEDYERWAKEAKPIDVHLSPDEIFRAHMSCPRAGYTPYTTEYDRWHSRKDREGKYVTEHEWQDDKGNPTVNQVDTTLGVRMADDDGLRRYNEVMSGGAGRVSVMARKVERAFMDKLRRGWRTGLNEGSFNPRRVVQAATFQPNIYRARDDVPSLNTAVSLLIDLSGSMNGGGKRRPDGKSSNKRKVGLAQEAAICMGEALNRVGIPFEVLGFNSTSDFPTVASQKQHQKAVSSGEVYGRWLPIDMYEFKLFDERLSECKVSLGNINRMVGGDNCDGESLVYCHRRLVRRPERKKIMLVFSDGQPATSSSDYGQLHQHMRDTTAAIERAGTKLVGVGIASDAVSQYYKDYTVLMDIDDLGKTTLDHIARFVLGDRFKVDNKDLLAKSA